MIDIGERAESPSGLKADNSIGRLLRDASR